MSTCSIKIVQEPFRQSSQILSQRLHVLIMTIVCNIILREYFFDKNLLDEIKANYGVKVHSVPPKIVPPDIIHR